MNTIDRLAGTFEGSGAWHDSAGKSAAYRVQQRAVATAEGFEVAFRHDFDDGTVIEARFTMNWIAPKIFRVDVSGAPAGHGYVFDGYCHYHIRLGEAFVEASYRSSADLVEVFGSSSRNTEGNYIVWKETLRRTAG